MGDKTKALKKENDVLKSKLNDIKRKFQSFKSKMGEQKDNNEAAATALPTTQDVQFLNDSSGGEYSLICAIYVCAALKSVALQPFWT